MDGGQQSGEHASAAPPPRSDGEQGSTRPGDPAEGPHASGSTGGQAPTGGTAPAVAVRGLAKAFATRAGPVTALNGVDLSVAPGEFFSLLGPSGCGKTTLLRCIAGFEEPDAGAVLLGGSDAAGVPPERRPVNTVFQSYALFPHLSVRDNIAFGLRRSGVPRREAARRVGEAIDLVELGGRERDRPDRLSGGQRQRVALARALVNRPRALLLDEPFAALDPVLRRSMRRELTRIQREVGIAFVHVTHDQSEALALADRLALLAGGTVVQTGTPAEVYERPASRFAAGFLGAANLLTGTAEAGAPAGWTDVRVGGGRVRAAGTTAPGAAVHLTVRPEKIALSTEPPLDGGGLCAVAGTVREADYLGGTTQYTVDAEGVQIAVHALNTGGPGTAVPRGAPVWLSWRPEHTRTLPE